MGLFDKVERHREEKDEKAPKVVFRDSPPQKGYVSRRGHYSGANAHFDMMQRKMKMAKKFKK